MPMYQVYEKDDHGREYGQAVFKHQEHANDFCERLNELYCSGTGEAFGFYVRTLPEGANLRDYLG